MKCENCGAKNHGIDRCYKCNAVLERKTNKKLVLTIAFLSISFVGVILFACFMLYNDYTKTRVIDYNISFDCDDIEDECVEEISDWIVVGNNDKGYFNVPSTFEDTSDSMVGCDAISYSPSDSLRNPRVSATAFNNVEYSEEWLDHYNLENFILNDLNGEVNTYYVGDKKVIHNILESSNAENFYYIDEYLPESGTNVVLVCEFDSVDDGHKDFANEVISSFNR